MKTVHTRASNGCCVRGTQRIVKQDGIPPTNAGAGSLLHKLLRSEIRREQSHLLQAFRFLSKSGCGLRQQSACLALSGNDVAVAVCG